MVRARTGNTVAGPVWSWFRRRPHDTRHELGTCITGDVPPITGTLPELHDDSLDTFPSTEQMPRGTVVRLTFRSSHSRRYAGRGLLAGTVQRCMGIRNTHHHHHGSTSCSMARPTTRRRVALPIGCAYSTACPTAPQPGTSARPLSTSTPTASPTTSTQNGVQDMCNCTRHIHSFVCYLRNIAVNANASAYGAGSAPNAR